MKNHDGLDASKYGPMDRINSSKRYVAAVLSDNLALDSEPKGEEMTNVKLPADMRVGDRLADGRTIAEIHRCGNGNWYWFRFDDGTLSEGIHALRKVAI